MNLRTDLGQKSQKERKMADSKGQAWFCVTGLPSDVEIEVDDMSFHFHKYPLMSKSKKFHDLITEREQNPRARSNEEEDEEIEEFELPHHFKLESFPGGAETFELAAKYCYGVKINLTAGNAAALRCAAEYLEMTEDFFVNNLVNLTERFLAKSVFRSLRGSIKALKSCENLLPLAEGLGIVQRCVDSIAARTSASDASSLFGWPITEEIAAAAGVRRKNGSINGGSDPWFEDLADLSLPIYKRVIAAMKEKDLSAEIIEGSLISYAKRSIPGVSRSSRHLAPPPSTSEIDQQKELLETIITNLPLEKSSAASSSNTTKFLFRLLRTLNILKASEESRVALERKIAMQLDQATIDDLLMPSYSYHQDETLYDVESVERILGYYLAGIEERSSAIMAAEEEREEAVMSPEGENKVARLVDGYLAEIASDVNLRPAKFCELAMAPPENARVYDDGLYRAVDIYLKAHRQLSEEERDKVCSIMDCRKLTLEACTHATQNERLPLRSIVQVLFFEQLQLRHAIAGSFIAPNTAMGPPDEHQPEGDTWRTAVRENQVLRLDMDSMQCRVEELLKECSRMRKAIDKVGRKGRREWTRSDGGSSAGRTFGCKFGTKVCDSQERTVTEPRKSQTEQHRHATP